MEALMELRDTPKVSVVLPVRNGGDRLREAVESILEQTLTSLEIVVVDDHSSDESVAVVRRFSDPRVLITRNRGKGLADALNTGIALARAPFIARMDADDIADKRRLEVQVSFLDKHPETVLFGSQVLRFSDYGDLAPSQLPLTHEGIVRALLAGQHAIAHPSVVMRSDALAAVGGYNPTVAEDWDLFLRLGEVGLLQNSSHTLLRYRFHAGSLSSSRLTAYRRDMYRAIENHRRRKRLLPEIGSAEYERSLSWSKRVAISAEAVGLELYRRGYGNIAAPSKVVAFKGLLSVAAASLLLPKFALRRLGSLLRQP
jgi:glycosyltransferase involved in cell wall biosynthesis